MPGLEDLYREIILDHYRTPRNRGELPPPAAHAVGHNPLCGDEVRGLVRRFKGMMSIEEEAPDGETVDQADIKLGDLEALQGVVKFPVRIKCATLAWNTLIEALAEATSQ